MLVTSGTVPEAGRTIVLLLVPLYKADCPAVPEDPEDPDVPEDPEDPLVPDDPEDPDDPVCPDDPDDPDDPGTPFKLVVQLDCAPLPEINFTDMAKAPVAEL